MILRGKKIAFGITGSLHTIEKLIPQIEKLVKEGADVIPIMSANCLETRAEIDEIISKIEDITKKKMILTIKEAEEAIRKENTDGMIIVPCSGTTIAKLANGIMDTAILIAVESHLRNEKNIIIGIATTEGLGLEAENIGKLLNRKKVFFVPFRQDNPITKPNSLRYSNQYIVETIVKALEGEQVQPILL